MEEIPVEKTLEEAKGKGVKAAQFYCWLMLLEQHTNNTWNNT